MAHRHTEKEAHLLSGPSGLQPSEDSRTQKFRSSTQVQQPRQEYSRFTETEKAKFQDPFIYNDDRNFVRHNSVDKFSPNLVYMTTPNTSSVSNSVFFIERKEENADIAEITEAEVPAPAPTLENSRNDHTLQEQGSQQRTLGDQPVHIVHIRTLFQPGLVDTQYNVGLYEHL